MTSFMKDSSRKLGSISGTVGEEQQQPKILSRSGSFKNLTQVGSFDKAELQFSASLANLNQTDSKDSAGSVSPSSESPKHPQKRFPRPSVKGGFKNLQQNIKQTREKARATFGRTNPKQQDIDSIFRSVSPTTSETNGNPEDALPVSSVPPIRLTSVVWKRRSGLGKLSTTKAWERRRICLRGNRIEYYTTDADILEQQEEEIQPLSPSPQPSHPKIANWMEQATQNAKATLGISYEEDPNAPRGSLDLIREEATVSASSRNNSSPTPFSLSIRVRGIETGWKLCFDSHSLQMEWLAALTDVIVSQSVASYNQQQLLGPESAVDEERITSTPKWLLEEQPQQQQQQQQEQQLQQNNHQQQGQQQQTKSKLWELEKYNITSAHLLEDTSDNETQEDDDTFQDESESAEEEHEQLREIGVAKPGDVTIATGSEKEPHERVGWFMKDIDFYMAVVILNLALVLCHTTSKAPSNFWYLFTFLNIALMNLISRQEKPAKRKIAPIPVVRRQVQASPASSIKGKQRSKERKERPKVPKTTTKTVKFDFRPQAGSTSIQIENPTDLPMFNNHIFAAWRTPHPKNLLVRSHGYLSSRKKTPSPGSLYDTAKCDIFESPHRYPNMATRVILPKVKFADDEGPKTWKTPDVFVISISLPTDPPKLTGSSNDGGGYTVCLYLTMKQETRDILRRITAPDYDPSTEPAPGDPQKSKINAVKLFEEWCRRAPTDGKFQSRFKVVPNAQNLKEIGMPSWISRYNGKPFLIKRPGETGFLYDHPELSCMEFDISLHPFPYLAKHAICFMKDVFFKKVLITFGFVIEGRSDDELPECLIGLLQLCYPDPIHAIQAEDVFTGVSPKSHT